MTKQSEERIREDIQTFKRFQVGVYAGIIHPLLQAGRERKHIARLICSWCGKVINANYETCNGKDSHGICVECSDKLLAKLDETDKQ